MSITINPLPLPSPLWNNNVLHIAPTVVEDLRSELVQINRFADACSESQMGQIGGADEESTYDHFAFAFPTSTARTEYLFLDPDSRFRPCADELLDSFTDGRISILDVPCGAGAGILGFLGTLAALREHGTIPRLPLEVFVTAGDYSPFARTLYDNMLVRASSWLSTRGIRLQWQTLAWNAEEEPTTAAIVDHWFTQSPTSEEWVVLVAAFSGEATKTDELLAAFGRSFQHIMALLHDRRGTALWVEPASNKGNKLFRFLGRMVRPLLKSWFKEAEYGEHRFSWQHPFRSIVPEGGIRLLHHKRTGI